MKINDILVEGDSLGLMIAKMQQRQTARDWNKLSTKEKLAQLKKDHEAADKRRKEYSGDEVDEGKSPHKKGTKKYKKHMAAMHAEDKRPSYVVSTKSKPKKSKPTTGGSSKHPYQNKLVGEGRGSKALMPGGKLIVGKGEVAFHDDYGWMARGWMDDDFEYFDSEQEARDFVEKEYKHRKEISKQVDNDRGESDYQRRARHFANEPRVSPWMKDDVDEADEPKPSTSARAKLDHSLRSQGHKVEKDRKKAAKRGEVKHKGRIEEGPLVLTKDSDLNKMINILLTSWLKQDHSDSDYEELLTALGYKMERDGPRTVIVKEDSMRNCPCCSGGSSSCSHGKKVCGTCSGSGKVAADFETEEFPLEEKGLAKAAGAAALIAALGMAMPSGKDTPLGMELAKAANSGDPVAAYHLDNLDTYIDADDQRTLVNLRIAYIEDSDREDVKAYLAKKANQPSILKQIGWNK